MKINFSNISQQFAESFGARQAIVNIERDRRYTYAEFHLLTNRIVNMMHAALELRRGDFWINMLENDNLALLHWFTAMKGEATAAYTNYRDSLEVHSAQIDQVKPKVAFVEAALLRTHHAMLRERGITVVCMDPPGAEFPDVLDFWQLVNAASQENPNVEHDDRDDLLIVRFTGGTTGQGKCAMYNADNMQMCKDSFYMLADPVFDDQSRVLHIAPLSHGSGMMFIAAQFKGCCNVTMNQPDLSAWCRHIAEERISVAFAVPTLLYRLLEMPPAQTAPLSSLKTMFYGAAPMSPGKLKDLQALLGNIFLQVYGATEHLGVAASMGTAEHLFDNGADAHLASAGRATPGVEVQIMDTHGNPVAQGERGEIWLRSRAICTGYYNNPQQTAEEFHDGYWKSGDIGRLDENGFVYIVDRKKDMIITGGFNVYANEVEAVINAHPAVSMSAVVGIPHEDWGEAILAEVVIKPGQTLATEALKQHVKEQLGSYKTPKQVVIVDTLPLSVVGKVLRRQVREKYFQDHFRKVN
ncbi:MAG: class I adenylate-forming enzyme family protein [Panacagrimonas sp.]